MNRITGQAELREVINQLREIDATGLRNEVWVAVKEAAENVKEDVKTELAETMPKRGGHAELITRAARTRVNQRQAGSGVKISVVGTAKGKVEKRDLNALNRGILRHPLFGRRSHWYTTSVKPGFFKRAGDKFLNRLHDQLADAIDHLARRIE